MNFESGWALHHITRARNRSTPIPSIRPTQTLSRWLATGKTASSAYGQGDDGQLAQMDKWRMQLSLMSSQFWVCCIVMHPPFAHVRYSESRAPSLGSKIEVNLGIGVHSARGRQVAGTSIMIAAGRCLGGHVPARVTAAYSNLIENPCSIQSSWSLEPVPVHRGHGFPWFPSPNCLPNL